MRCKMVQRVIKSRRNSPGAGDDTNFKFSKSQSGPNFAFYLSKS